MIVPWPLTLIWLVWSVANTITAPTHVGFHIIAQLWKVWLMKYLNKDYLTIIIFLSKTQLTYKTFSFKHVYTRFNFNCQSQLRKKVSNVDGRVVTASRRKREKRLAWARRRWNIVKKVLNALSIPMIHPLAFAGKMVRVLVIKSTLNLRCSKFIDLIPENCVIWNALIYV